MHGIGLLDAAIFEKDETGFSVGIRRTNASAFSRASRSRCRIIFGSIGSLAIRERHSSGGYEEFLQISAIRPSGVKPGALSTAAQITAPSGKMVFVNRHQID